MFVTGGSSLISIQSKFINGDVSFSWNFSTSVLSPYVFVEADTWIKVAATTYTVQNVLLYDHIYIDAKDGANRIGDIWKYKGKLTIIWNIKWFSTVYEWYLYLSDIPIGVGRVAKQRVSPNGDVR